MIMKMLMNKTKLMLVVFSLLVAAVLSISWASRVEAQEVGSKEKPLRVILIPADGGTEDGTKADFQPVFNAVTRTTGIHFDIRAANTYGAAVEAMCSRVADIAFFGAVTYLQARSRGCAELLAITVEKNESVYYSGMFVPANSSVKSIKDIKGKRAAFGDANSTSSFVYPVAMILDAGINPASDLGAVLITGSHVNSLKALQEGHADVAFASFDSYEKAVKQGAIDSAKVKAAIKSEPIPNPPLAMHPELPKKIKDKLRDAFNNVHKAPGITPEMIRGYGGKKVDRYDANLSESMMLPALKKLELVNDTIKGEILKKAAKR